MGLQITFTNTFIYSSTLFHPLADVEGVVVRLFLLEVGGNRHLDSHLQGRR